MVERFHRQLKSSLAATTQQRAEWSQALPLVLLGIRSSLKIDLGHCSAELVYGTTLKLPGELLASTPQPECSVRDYASTLKNWMNDLQPTQPRSSSARVFVSQDLSECTHVFVRDDAVKRPYTTTVRRTIQSDS